MLQYVTWSVNSLRHMIGTRPYASRRFDRSIDLWPLALISLGESWHNGLPLRTNLRSRGIGPRQIDLSASMIRIFERLGWATAVHRPTSERPRRLPP